MPDFRDQAPEPELEAALAVIDATLAGEPVAPEDAELAELALILVGERPQARPEFARELDERFRDRPHLRVRRRWRLAPWMPASVATVAAIVLAVVLVAPALRGSGASSEASSSAAGSSASGALEAPRSHASSKAPANGSSTAPSAAGTASAQSLSPAPATPATSGRQVVQSASISLTAATGEVDDVAQRVFDIAGREDGVVQNSSVSTGTSAGYAQIQLSVPSANLEPTMTALSEIAGAQVSSRTDNTQDITGQVGGVGRRLFDARQLRTSLLKQLAAATTTNQIDSIQQQLNDVESQINSLQSKLNGLHSQVANSQIQVQINGGLTAGGAAGGGFTLRRALHDAGRVLIVAAGVGLIAAAVLIPLGLAAGLLIGLTSLARRRRREQALDLI